MKDKIKNLKSGTWFYYEGHRYYLLPHMFCEPGFRIAVSDKENLVQIHTFNEDDKVEQV